MKFEGPLLAVRDLAASRSFYETLLGQKLCYDFGANISFESGLSLQTLIVASRTRPSRDGRRSCERGGSEKGCCCCDGSRRVASACERGRHAFVRRRRGLGICAGSSAFVSGYAALVPSFPLSGSFARLSDAALLYFDLKDPFSRKDVLWRIPLAPVRRKLCASPLSS